MYPNATVLLAAVLASMGLCGTVIKVCEACKVDMTWLTGFGRLSVYLICLHSVLVGCVAVMIRRALGREAVQAVPEAKAGPTILINDLILSLKRALTNGRYTEVMRIGSALSRPLFESGSFEARLVMGELVEEAAAAVSDRPAQMVALIDLMGWSCVELGDYTRAEQELAHGQEIASALQDFLYLAKTQRHLGVICRRQKRYPEAEGFYKGAMDFAKQLQDPEVRGKAIADIDYARACLFEYTTKYADALTAVDAAITGFTKAGDRYKMTMAQAD